MPRRSAALCVAALAALLCASGAAALHRDFSSLVRAFTGARVQAPPMDLWKDVATARGADSLVTAFRNYYQDVKCNWGTLPGKCSSYVGYDWYPLRITQLPTGKSIGDVFDFLRADLVKGADTHIVDTSVSKFAPYNDAHKATWASANPVGAYVHIDMYAAGLNADDGAVVCIKYLKQADRGYWVFATIHTVADGEHPVSGNRQFGYYKEGNNYIVYTKGFDRMTGRGKMVVNGGIGLITENPAFKAQKQLWTSFQDKIVAYVNSNGGAASKMESFAGVKLFSEVWPLYTELCHTHSGNPVAKAAGDCETTNTFSCDTGRDGTCRSKASDPCSGNCICSSVSTVNKCQCIKSRTPSKVCDPWESVSAI